MAFVRVGGVPSAGLADTSSKRTIIDAQLAAQAGAVDTGKTGVMNIAGHKLRGRIMRVAIVVPRSTCGAFVDAFVPNEGQPFRKGLLLGTDFLQPAKMLIDTETGEAYCKPARRSKR